MAVTFRATFFGPQEQQNNSSSALMPGKGIGFGWTKFLYGPLGIEHFFDAFFFDPQRPWRAAACQALSIPSCHVSEDTHLEQVHKNKFSLTPRRIPVERKTPAAKRGLDQDMVAQEETFFFPALPSEHGA